MEQTGERFIPDLVEDPAIAYEHWHRYLFAAQFVPGKAVLDLASGEGYGSHCLAGVARQVVGVDPDPEAVRHASNKYLRANLEFRCGSAEVIPVEGRHVFDAVVSFETIEHIWEEQQLTFLRGVERLLKPEGIFLVSTPNRTYYTAAEGLKNIFHRHEFDCREYLTLLRKFFRTVHLLGQKVYPASYLWPVGAPVRRWSEYQLTQAGGEYIPAAGDQKELYYMIAVCSNGEVEAPDGSVLLDVSRRPARAQPKPAAAPAATNGGEAIQGAIAELRLAFEQHLMDERTQRQIQEIVREKDVGMTQLQQHAHDLTREREASQREAAELQRQMQEFSKDREARQREVAELQHQVQELAKDRDASQHEAAELHRQAQELAKDRDTWQREAAEFQAQAQELAKDRDACQREAAELHNQAQELAKEREAAQREAAELRQTIEEQSRELGELKLRVDLLSDREKELRALLVDAHDQLLRRDEEIQILLAKALQHHGPVVTGSVSANAVSIPSSYLGYQLVIHQIREVVRDTLPLDAIVLVVSKGDTELLKLPVKETRHFPMREDGAYAGYYPADSAAAIAHLKECHAKGAQYLLFPSTALWWLEYYKEFREYLEEHFQVVVRRDDAGIIFALNKPGAGVQAQQYRKLVRQVRELVRETLPPDATVLVVNKGDDELIKLDGRDGHHFPQTADGEYAGHNPADSAAAIAHLEALRAKGAGYLLFPETARWWLDHYADLRKHLEARYEKVADREGVGVIFSLLKSANGEARRKYQELVKRVRDVVRDAVPPDATVLVVSKGDQELVKFDGRRGWHFPQTPGGEYAGHNPADSAAAIEHLEALRAKGAGYLLFPATALWWLDHYADLRKHLDDRYRRERSDDSCVIYRIKRDEVAAAAPATSAPAFLPGRASGAVDPGRESVGAAPAVLASGGGKEVKPE